MIIVTGGAGMIGSNLINKLNKMNRKDIIIVDDLTDGYKSRNLKDLDFYDYIDKDDFINLIRNNQFTEKVETVFHQGACSTTTEWNGKFIMKNNYEFSKILLNWCQENAVQFIGASSASVYGLGEKGFIEKRDNESPINMYAFSKFQFDQYIRGIKTKRSQIVSLRYFNVYGPKEFHKGHMASMFFHFNNQILKDGKCKLFKGISGYKDGEQRRDFVYVEDCVSVNIWFMMNPDVSGIFNVGTGKSNSINAIANCILNWHKRKNNAKNYEIEYIPFPDHLKGSYQNYTQANIDLLKSVGYKEKFIDIEEGVSKYLEILNKS